MAYKTNRLLFTKIMFTLDEFETYMKKTIETFKYEEGKLYITTTDDLDFTIIIEE